VGDAYIPAQERLYAGGATTVRGFRQNELGPVVYIPTAYDTVQADGTPGGDPLNLAQTVYFRANAAKVGQRAIPVGGNALLVATTLNAEIDTFAQSAADKLTRTALEQHIASTITGSGMLVSNLERAAELIAGFKQLAVDQTSEQRRVYALRTMIDEVMVAMRPALRRAPFLFDVDVPADITLDGYPGPLSRVLVNFINNALLHAFEGRSAGRMSLSAKLLDAQQVELIFADDGVGMSADVLHRIFDPFYTTKLGRGGSGLGMHIAYSIITVMHGGHLEVTSKHGHGAQFRCVLPVSAPMRVDGLAPAGEVGAGSTASA
jgi:K+-sensing histidine kinase KdpD